ncbi:universal stress protein [Paracoccus sp. 228]|uniref:universal stress protein n=1 Tax=Paracoccus sp. 228 TaxID=1192054 RepID=UPI0005E5B8B5|nr:universal stress protein [Paracoccus sp. 228]KIX17011.1 universal stress protein UspA [Paracoccus sp. 228]
MNDKIIALVDGSVYAASVCEHAGWLAARSGMPVELLHVLGRRSPAPSQDLSGTIRLGARSALLDELASLDEQRARLANAQGRALLEDARNLTLGAGAARVETRLEQGDLIAHATGKASSPALIVIGKRGEAADFAADHPGSNLERVVRAAKVPVLVAARAFRPIASVMLAFDGGASAMKAVDHVASSPVFDGLRIEVAMAAPANREAQVQLEEAILRLRAAGRDARAELLDGSADSALIARIEQQDHDLLVMGAYGHSRIRRLIIGSVTTRMLIDSRRSVLLFR